MALGGLGALPFGWLPIGSDGGGSGSVGASNGLSIDPISGDVVLGNDLGDPSGPAQLLSSREILMNNQIIYFQGPTSQVGIQQDNIQMNSLPGAESAIFISTLPGVAVIQMGGDSSISNHPPSIQMTDSAVLGRNYFMEVFEDTYRVRTNNVLLKRLILLDAVNEQYQFGDIDAVNNGSNIFVDDQNSRITAKAGATNNALFLDAPNKNWSIGDPVNEFLLIDGINQRANIFLGTTALDLSVQTGVYAMGDIDSSGNSTTVTADDTNARIILTAGNGIRTNDPGAGPGDWLLGQVITAASVLDNTQYVEVKINGATVKLATMQ